MQSRIILHLDLWEIREVHTFTNRKNPSSFIEEREHSQSIRYEKKPPLKTAKTNDTLSLLHSIYKQTLIG